MTPIALTRSCRCDVVCVPALAGDTRVKKPSGLTLTPRARARALVLERNEQVLSNCHSLAELHTTTSSIFHVLDADLSGAVGLEEVQQGLHKILPAGATVFINCDDWAEVREFELLDMKLTRYFELLDMRLTLMRERETLE